MKQNAKVVAHCVSDSGYKSLYDSFGNYDAEKHGPAVNNLQHIIEQKYDERIFAAITNSWLRHLLFGKTKGQDDENYRDLSTFHYPHHKEYLDFMALKQGSIDRQTSLTFKEILLVILLVLDYIRTGFILPF